MNQATQAYLLAKWFNGTRLKLLAIAILIPLAAGPVSAFAQSAAPVAKDETLHSIHDALFSSFLPIDELEKTSTNAKLLAETRDDIWSASHESPLFRRMLIPFTNVRTLGTDCNIRQILPPAPSSLAFSALGPKQRRRLLLALESCNENGPRHAVMTARSFYIVKAYGALQENFSGIRLNLFAPADYIEQHTPVLPPTRLRYDRSKKELTSADGVFDYLIVGSGPAGSVLAHELRKNGNRVLLLERGSFVIPGAMETRLIGDLTDARTSTDGGIWIHNGMAVGGGSQVNVDLCFAPTLPAIQAKIQSWRSDQLIGAGDFTPEQIATAYTWVKKMLGTRAISESEINSNNLELWNGARLAGFHPKLYDLNTFPPGNSPSPVTDKRSSEGQLLISALTESLNPLSILPDADVQRILFDNRDGLQTAIGVEVRMHAPLSYPGIMVDPNHLSIPTGEIFTVHARTIILSAGALGSPTLLLRSGVNNRQIGKGVILHPSMPILGLFKSPINAMTGTEASVYVDDRLIDRGYAFESMSAEPLYAALMSPGSAVYTYNIVRSYSHLAGFGVMLIDSVSPQNQLTLDENGDPQITYTLSDADKNRFREGIAEAVKIMFLAGARKVYLPTTENVWTGKRNMLPDTAVFTDIHQADLLRKNLDFIPNRTIITSAHMQATDKMGLNADNSVVGTDLHVWGTRNLYVVDGSVFPTSVGANPMQTIYTFAKIFADQRNNATPSITTN